MKIYKIIKGYKGTSERKKSILPWNMKMTYKKEHKISKMGHLIRNKGVTIKNIYT